MSCAWLARPSTRRAVWPISAFIWRSERTVCPTRARPLPAARSERLEASAVELALRATSSTAALISLTAVAAISISSFCRASDRLPSSVTAFSCSAAAASSAAESPICSMVSCRLACMLRMAFISCAGSSSPSLAISPVRSRAAMRSAQDTAWRIGTTMLRVSSQAIVTLAARATSSTARIAVEARE